MSGYKIIKLSMILLFMPEAESNILYGGLNLFWQPYKSNFDTPYADLKAKLSLIESLAFLFSFKNEVIYAFESVVVSLNH